MNKKELPQDKSPLEGISKELCYTVDESGKYTTDLSKGWEVKAAALDVAWDDVKERVNEAREKVLAGEASPILYYMELKLMDLSLLSSYTGFWKWRIKRHMKPGIFQKLSQKKLEKYALAFDISVEELRKVE